MEKHLATAGAVIAVLTAIVGTTIAIETRYAKAAEVAAQLDEFYAKQLKLKIKSLKVYLDTIYALVSEDCVSPAFIEDLKLIC